MQLDDFNDAIPTLEYFNFRSNTPTWHIEPSVIEFIDLSYVVNGRATYVINQQRIEVSAGNLVCIPKGATRAAKSYDPLEFECYATNLHLRSPIGQDVVLPLPLVSQVGMHGDIITRYRTLNEIWLSRPPGYTMRTRAHFMLILQRFFALLVYEVDTYNYDPRVKKAISFITTNFAEPLTISTVANAVSLNPIYFGALFKKETHYTFRDYLNTVRLNQAEDMLRSGKFNVTEVAQHCGFADIFYFSRIFKKHKGIPPSTLNSKGD